MTLGAGATALTFLLLAVSGSPTALGSPLRGPLASRYATAVLADHPIAYYRMDESSGTVAYDASGNGLDATYTPGAQPGAAGALRDDPDTTVVGGLSQSGDALPASTSPRTVEVWVHDVDGGFTLFKYGDTAGGAGFVVSIGDHGGSVTVGGGVNAPSVSVPAGLASGWHLLDVTYDGDRVEVFQDGQVIGGGALGAIGASVASQGMQLRTSTGAAVPSTFRLDELAIYGAALSPEQIGAHWTAGAASAALPACAAAPTDRYGREVTADSPLGYWRLSEPAANPGDAVAFDYSSHCLNGSYGGAATAAPGALFASSDGTVVGGMTQSGDQLPKGHSPRTVEAWVRDVDNGFTLVKYGDAAGGAGFTVSIGQGGRSVTAAAGGATVTVPTLPGFGSGFHLLDVTYDGDTVEVFQDGQVIGGGALGTIDTAVPGQGMQVQTSIGAAPAATFRVDEPAVYGAALSPVRIAAHWTAGASDHACAPAPSGPYAAAVLADAPSAYYRLDDTAGPAATRVAFDSSGHCANAAYIGSPPASLGALPGDDDPSVAQPGLVVSQSADGLPAGSAERTVEVWVHNVDGGFPLLRYGDVQGGAGFEVDVGDHGGSITVNAGAASISTPTLAGFGSGWHLVDVTYDGTTARIYQDGQSIVTQTMPVSTALPGQGLRVAASTGADYAGPHNTDELAIYPRALGSSRILAHYEAATQPPQRRSVVAGAATLGDGTGAQGARVQACPVPAGTCTVLPYPIDRPGEFHLLVAPGTYTVSIFPPPGSPSAVQTIRGVTVPPDAVSLRAEFAPPGGLPTGATFTVAGHAPVQDVVPRLGWGDPSRFSVGACTHGFGMVNVAGINQTTGQPENATSRLVETPRGSGAYQAEIPPLVPIHGGTVGTDAIVCPPRLGLVPTGGPPDGGTDVFLDGAGFAGATAVTFGATPARSFSVLSDNVIEATSPPGAGSVAVTVTGRAGNAISAGTFTYFRVDSLDTTSGPSTGGTVVTIHGQGFSAGDQVVFGLVASRSVTFVSPTELRAVAPPGLGRVDVRVLQGNSVSPPSDQARFANDGGPPGTSSLDQAGTPPQVYAVEVRAACSLSTLGGAVGVTVETQYPLMCEGAQIEIQLGAEYTADRLVFHNGFDAFFSEAAEAFFGEAAGSIVTKALAVLNPIAKFWFIVSAGNDVCELLTGGGCRWDFWNLFIDPSGAVVDTAGNPVDGATATLLGASALTGPFAPVDPAGGSITPATNPQTTGADGGFEWNALAGAYEVEALKAGCHAPGDAAQPDVFTAPFAIPPPAVGLLLTLDCGTATPPAPAVTGLSAGQGPAGGGNTVDISGSGLTGATAVRFGDAPATQVKVLSPYALAAVAPAGGGTVDVTVTTPGGTSAAGPAARYAYVAPQATAGGPQVAGVSPASGPLSGGTLVKVTGDRLAGAYAVTFGGTPSTTFTVVSPTEVQAIAPAAQFEARVDVAITTPSGTSPPVAADGFTYGSPPPRPAITVTLTAAPSPAELGQPVGLTARVSPTDGGGTVTFFDAASGTPICEAVALSDAHEADCATSTLAQGDHTLRAVYSGDASYPGGSGVTSVTIAGVTPAPSPTVQAPGPPVNAALPTLSGTTTAGHTLSASPGRWSGAGPVAFGYRWQLCRRSCTAVEAATGDSYRLVAADVGAQVRVAVTATNPAGSATAESLPSATVGPARAAIKAALAAILVPRGKRARIPALRARHGLTTAFSAPSAGRLTVSWRARRGGARAVLMAAGNVTTRRAGRETLRIALTRAGLRLLGTSRRVDVTARATFAPLGASTVAAQRRFALTP